MENATIQKETASQRKMHCPRCGSTRLTVQSINRVVSSATTAHSVGKHAAIGMTSYDTESESFWFCQDCGKKFRDLDELLSLSAKCMKKGQRANTMLIIFTVMALLFFIVFLMTLDVGGITIIPFLIFLGVAIAFYAFKRYWQKKGLEAKQEHDELATRVWLN